MSQKSHGKRLESLFQTIKRQGQDLINAQTLRKLTGTSDPIWFLTFQSKIPESIQTFGFCNRMFVKFGSLWWWIWAEQISWLCFIPSHREAAAQ